METTELEEYQQFVESCPQPTEDKLEKVKGSYYKGWWAATQMTCEAGEVLEIFEKAIRKDKDIDANQIMDECGDVLWGIAAICNTVGITLDDVIAHNIDKLRKRYDEAAKQG